MASMWDRHAPLYEEVFERSTWLWARDALTLADVPEIQPGQPKPRFLDVACGSGKFAFTAAELGYDVTATDLSSGMIERVNNKAAKYPHLKVEARVVDGQTLDGIPDNSVDYVSSFFGLCMFPQRELALKSALRVLKPGGQVLLSSWHATSNNMRLIRYVLEHAINKPDVVEVDGPSFMGAQNRTLAVDSFAEELKETGFSDVIVHPVVHSMILKSGEEFVTTLLDNGGVGAAVSKKDPESVKLAALHYCQQLVDGVDPFSPSIETAVVDTSKSPFVPRVDNRAVDHPLWRRAFSFPALGLIALARKL
ncbi:hypothetical protein Poli38472_012514 [Pythium oligandrum]|uniref:Methyltransferase type 11 domain-containing protein n=1 Tax=Pythium oligandrum TaxID=41045 RepID=A0A8K1CE35_PYTOL|nr:hypothetical protein Poli38472_012514 [Pythium oligandrum]|eukprot:TMW61323.1 hypothetical protein Poli38472_012514 [Pythium oligandrum]